MADKIKEFEFEADDFVLVNNDSVIHDEKFETKPTTFFKDAVKRFCKNKSSVAGGIILLILILLAIFVPIFSPYDIETIRSEEKFLAPKLFEAGTGFWEEEEGSGTGWHCSEVTASVALVLSSAEQESWSKLNKSSFSL